MTSHITSHMIAFNKIPIVSYGFLPTLAKHLWRVPKLICSQEDYIKSQNKTVCFDYKNDKTLVTANANFIKTSNTNRSLMRLYCNINNIKYEATEFCYYSNKYIDNKILDSEIYINYILSVLIKDKKYDVSYQFKYNDCNDYLLNDFHVFLPGKIQFLLKDTNDILEEHARHIGIVN